MVNNHTSYITDLELFLSEQRYASNTIRLHLAAAKNFGQWLEHNNVVLTDVHEVTVSQYIKDLRKKKKSGRTISKAISGLHHLLFMLRTQKVIPQPAELSVTNSERWLHEFDHYLSHVVGLAPTTRKKYFFFIRRFLNQYCGTAYPDWSHLKADFLTAFVQQEISRLDKNSRTAPITATRALLRYLVFMGEIAKGMISAVPVVRRWKHDTLPKYLSPEEVERIITGTLDHSTASLRNHAILLLLARLGLRAKEVIQLSLDDIDWREGIILVRAGKTHRERQLPLPKEVGFALFKYLKQERPCSSSRIIFLCYKAPFKPLCDSSAISKIVRRTMNRVGVTNKAAAAHLLRHSAATGMLVKGANFKEIADVLGHLSLQTTAIYAKLDLPALTQVALPWPGGE